LNQGGSIAADYFINEALKMRDEQVTRRTFLQTLAVAVPVGATLLNGEARAQDVVKLDINDPTAKALVYVENAADVDTANPLAARFEAGQDCSNCAQIQGDEGAEFRPCAIFPGKRVANKGWCSVWAPKP
jgi:hypothetical protein